MDFLTTMLEGTLVLSAGVFLVFLQIPIYFLGEIVNRMLRFPKSSKFPDYRDSLTGNLMVLVMLFVIYILGTIF